MAGILVFRLSFSCSLGYGAINSFVCTTSYTTLQTQTLNPKRRALVYYEYTTSHDAAITSTPHGTRHPMTAR